MKTVLLLLLVCFGSLSCRAEDEYKALLAKVDVLQKELLPATGAFRTNIERLWGTPKETHGETEVNTISGATKRLLGCSYLLIPHYWLCVSYDGEGRCFRAFFSSRDPRVPWDPDGQKEYTTLDDAKERLQLLQQLKAMREDPEKKDSNPQGGANGRRPFSSETNQMSAAAAFRRSP